MILSGLVAVLVGCLCVWLGNKAIANHNMKQLARARGCREPPKYPHLDPFFGLDLFLRIGKAIQEHRYLPELDYQYGSLGQTFATKAWGYTSINSIAPENLKTVFSTRFDDWGVENVRLTALHPFCGRGFITTDGPAWEHSRSLLRPSFYREHAVDLPALEKYLRLVLALIPRDGSTVDLQSLVFSLYLDTATLFLFGQSFDSLSGTTTKEAQDFLRAFDHAMLGSGTRIALGPLQFVYRSKAWFQSCAATHNFADTYVQKALKHRRSLLSNADKVKDQNGTHDTSQTLLHAMAGLTDDKNELRNQILQALMAAQETTASLISNVFFLLSRHQSVWETLQNEIREIGDAELSPQLLASMTYIRFVLNETLRLCPVFPQMNRIARVDTILPVGGGSDGASPIFAPAGTMFGTSWYNLHRLKSIWGPDAHQFKPSRWESFKPDSWQYVPFGGGPRGCLGRTKALTEASYVIVRIMQEFSGIESRDDRDWTGLVQLTAKNAHGCKIALVPRY